MKKRTVLIVEDQLKDLFRSIVEIGGKGITVITAESGPEGVRKARLLCPDLIIMDIRLPVYDGIEATRRIREFDANVPIIAVTAYPQYKDRALEAGASHYLQKPVDAKELLAHIHQFMG